MVVDCRIRTKKGPQLTRWAPLFPGVDSVLVVSGEPTTSHTHSRRLGLLPPEDIPSGDEVPGDPSQPAGVRLPTHVWEVPTATHREEGGSGGLGTLTLGHCHPPGSHPSSSLDTYISLW